VPVTTIETRLARARRMVRDQWQRREQNRSPAPAARSTPCLAPEVTHE
jgi:hypothetical protein